MSRCAIPIIIFSAVACSASSAEAGLVNRSSNWKSIPSGVSWPDALSRPADAPGPDLLARHVVRGHRHHVYRHHYRHRPHPGWHHRHHHHHHGWYPHRYPIIHPGGYYYRHYGGVRLHGPHVSLWIGF